MRAGSVLISLVLAALPARAFDADIVRAAGRHGLPVALVQAVVAVESAGDPRAVSSRGAMGLMQLMPATASRFGVDDPLDPGQSLEGGCAYLRWLIDRFDGSVALALAAYNAGESAVDRYAGIPPYEETRTYVRRVLERYTPTPTRSSSSSSPSSLVSLVRAGVASSIVGGVAR
ncbi:MAG: lytic transglycosylase domain-containing protein [Acidobacteriota bacterium]